MNNKNIFNSFLIPISYQNNLCNKIIKDFKLFNFFVFCFIFLQFLLYFAGIRIVSKHYLIEKGITLEF